MTLDFMRMFQGELVVMDEGKRVEGPMINDLIWLRGKEEDVGLDEFIGEEAMSVSKIGEFGGDIDSGLLGERGCEILFGGGEGGRFQEVFSLEGKGRLDLGRIGLKMQTRRGQECFELLLMAVPYGYGGPE
ncbi:hypothetical protein Tco_1284709 [Tanacetum coccineum]